MNRHLALLFQSVHEGIGVVGGDQPRHVLDADRIRADLLQSFCLSQVVLEVVDLPAQARFGEGVADGSLEVPLVFFDDLHGSLEVAEVIQGVEYPEYVDAVVAGPLNEGLHHVIGVVAVADQVLSAEQHGEGRAFDVLLQRAQPLPGILVQVAVGRVEGGPAPDLHRVKTHPVQILGHDQHILGPPARGKEGLMPVAQRKVLDFHGVRSFRPLRPVLEFRHFHNTVFVHHTLLEEPLLCIRARMFMIRCRPYSAQGLGAEPPPGRAAELPPPAPITAVSLLCASRAASAAAIAAMCLLSATCLPDLLSLTAVCCRAFSQAPPRSFR
jgi:hypothetical protein